MVAASGIPEQQSPDVPGAPPELLPGLRWRRVFPGDGRQLAVVRRWLASLLPGSPARDDLATVATELCSNAIRHTASGRGGCFAVEITWYGPAVRVAVADGGGPTEPRVLEDDQAVEYGRGLLLVRGLSVRTGVSGDQRGRLVWADVRWEDPAGAGAAARGDPYEAAIRDGEAALARRFAGVPAWFGRSTLQWWAVPDSGGLVSASSARELAALLYRLDAERAERSAARGRSRQRAREQRGARPGREPGGLLRQAEPGARSRKYRTDARPARGDGTLRHPRGNRGRVRVLSGRPRLSFVPASLASGVA